jgi:CRISPR/Cas system Type II protein with McrA/HNH and RuvC-like nuclease domain
MWLQHDHVLPHARGGDNSFENLVITCAACNYARMDFTPDELGLIDPRGRSPVRSNWVGLERFR